MIMFQAMRPYKYVEVVLSWGWYPTWHPLEICRDISGYHCDWERGGVQMPSSPHGAGFSTFLCYTIQSYLTKSK